MSLQKPRSSVVSICIANNLGNISIASKKRGRIVAFLRLYPAISLTLSPDSPHPTAPPYERRENRIWVLIQIMLLMGISMGDFTEALEALIDGSVTIIMEGRISAGKDIAGRLLVASS